MSKITICEGEVYWTSKKDTIFHSEESINISAAKVVRKNGIKNGEKIGNFKNLKEGESNLLSVKEIKCTNCGDENLVSLKGKYSFKVVKFSKDVEVGNKELSDVKWAYKIDDGAIQHFKNKGNILNNTVIKKITIDKSLYDNNRLTVYAYINNIGSEGKLTIYITGKGRALLIAFPEQSATIPSKQKVYRFFENTFGDGDNKVNDAGHAAIVIISEKDGTDYKRGFTKYYDFGRYDERKSDLGERDETNEGIVRSSKYVSGLSIPDWDFDKSHKENAEAILKKLSSSGKFKGYGKMIAALGFNLDFKKMYDYACYIEERGLVPFGGHLSSDNKDNATYCAKFARGVARAGGMDWDFNTLRGSANVEDILETYGGEKFEIKN